MSKVRVGVVGAGFMAQYAHILCFQQAPDAQVTALVSSRPNLLNQVADRFGIEKRYASVSELASDPDIDLAMVSAPPEINVPLCVELLEAGKHVFCEKPVALRVADAQRLVDAAAAAGRRCMVGFMKRADAGVRIAKGIVDDWRESSEAGKLLFARVHSFIGGDWQGNIMSLSSQIKTDEPMSPKATTPSPDWLPEDFAGAWGPYYFFNHVHSHDMDLLNLFLGRECSVLHADWGADAKTALLDYAGVRASIEVGKCANNTRWDEVLTVYFEGGSVEVALPPPLLINAPAEVRVHYMADRQEVCSPQARYSWSFMEQARNAVEVVQGAAEPLCTAEDGLAQLKMTEAIFRHLAG